MQAPSTMNHKANASQGCARLSQRKALSTFSFGCGSRHQCQNGLPWYVEICKTCGFCPSDRVILSHPVKHPNPTTKMGSKLVGEFTYQPKWTTNQNEDPKAVLTDSFTSKWVWVKIKPPWNHRFDSCFHLLGATHFGYLLFCPHTQAPPLARFSSRSPFAVRRGARGPPVGRTARGPPSDRLRGEREAVSNCRWKPQMIKWLSFVGVKGNRFHYWTFLLFYIQGSEPNVCGSKPF